MIAICDTGPLYATVDKADANHQRSLDVLSRRDFDLVIPALVIAEVCYFIDKFLDAGAEAAFLRTLPSFEVHAPMQEDWVIIANLVEHYSDFPLGATDASIAVLAERLGTDLVITLDRRHFAAIRMSDGRPFTLLPE